MRKITEKLLLYDGSIVRKKKDLKKLLNYNILNLLNKAHRNDNNMPELLCDIKEFPDYLALYKQPSLYNKTELTAVCFYEYDIDFDGISGLYNAIYYNDKKRLDFFKKRFKNVRIFITPDYSLFGDIYEPENIIRLWKARIVTLWLSLEMKAVVIPNIICISESEHPKYFNGLEKCKTLAISTKGHIRYKRDRALLYSSVKYAVEHTAMENLVVYSSSGKDENVLKTLKYAVDHNINIIIPDNTLRRRNIERSCCK